MEALSKTLTHGDFDSVFQEVDQPETVAWTTEGELRLFHLNITFMCCPSKMLKKIRKPSWRRCWKETLTCHE